MTNKTIAISGASGFIGTYLTSYFENMGYTIIPLPRKILNDKNNEQLANILEKANIVINLAGETINHRWSKSYKEKLYHSRIDTTRRITEAISLNKQKPELFISASAVGYYPSEGCYDEYTSKIGKGFLAQLCEQWEQEAQNISNDTRLAITRFGVVLSKKDGAFQQMTLASRLFKVSTIIGPGSQPFPWIDIEDLANAMNLIINDSSLKGAINFVSPKKIDNKEFTKTIAKYYKSWFTIKIPKTLFRIVLGESSTFMTEGQCVYPAKLTNAGFRYKSPTIADFLNNSHHPSI